MTSDWKFCKASHENGTWASQRCFFRKLNWHSQTGCMWMSLEFIGCQSAFNVRDDRWPSHRLQKYMYATGVHHASLASVLSWHFIQHWHEQSQAVGYFLSLALRSLLANWEILSHFSSPGRSSCGVYVCVLAFQAKRTFYLVFWTPLHERMSTTKPNNAYLEHCSSSGIAGLGPFCLLLVYPMHASCSKCFSRKSSCTCPSAFHRGCKPPSFSSRLCSQLSQRRKAVTVNNVLTERFRFVERPLLGCLCRGPVSVSRGCAAILQDCLHGVQVIRRSTLQNAVFSECMVRKPLELADQNWCQSVWGGR